MNLQNIKKLKSFLQKTSTPSEMFCQDDAIAYRIAKTVTKMPYLVDEVFGKTINQIFM